MRGFEDAGIGDAGRANRYLKPLGKTLGDGYLFQ